VKKLADKVNAPRDTPEACLGAVEDRVDEVALHGICLGTTLGLAAMATHTGVDYSTRPRDFHGGASEDIDDIEVILEGLDSHGDAIADSIHPSLC
jgi:anthranilate/para-aminobenzoate synthase component II